MPISQGCHMPDATHAPAEYSVPKYMPAIDGLRAFAVLAVLLVHFPWMPSSATPFSIDCTFGLSCNTDGWA